QTEDSLTWTYTVEEGMTWSDGVPVTAEDILYTLRYEDEHGGTNFVDRTDETGKLTQAKYIDYALSEDARSLSLTLRTVNIREPYDMLTFYTLPEHVYEREEPDEEELRVGCGPYVLDQFDADEGTLVFLPNEYYPVLPSAAKLVYRLYPNEEALYIALDQGDIHMAWDYAFGVPAVCVDVLSRNEDLQITATSTTSVPAALAFNSAKGPCADRNVRLAISYALNYDAFVCYLGSSSAQVATRGFVPPATTGYVQTERLCEDIEKAKDALAASGYTKKNADGFYVNASGEELSFVLTVDRSRTTHVRCGEIVKTQLEAFGIRVEIDSVEPSVYREKTGNGFSGKNVSMEAAIFSCSAADMGAAGGLGTTFVDGNHALWGGCQVFDGEFQSIKAKLSGAKTLSDYRSAAAQMQEYYAKAVPVIALYWDELMFVSSVELAQMSIDATFGYNNAINWITVRNAENSEEEETE
ncbi:MAG: ABC transporter substrate-binding protein, partial [Christensenellaceae bacterium]